MIPRRPVVPSVSVHDARARLDDPTSLGQGPLLVDVREPDEFAQVRVPGSVLLPLSTFVQRFHELPASRPLLMFCRTGNRSGSATAFLIANGYPSAANVEGGIVAWYQAGLPVDTGAPAAGDGDLPR
jgi:rhodanese-related sulfurtransferase